ncbi:MAG: cytochrome c [Acidobacteria bacterium]|nr:cytochrome c [Acidobacteriota bacterium]MBI3279071.1 cytochrome c [Acidobacteriota bacterium]
MARFSPERYGSGAGARVMVEAVRRGLLITMLTAAAVPAGAHETITTKLTWTREISRIVYRRCVSCHREGGGAFPLVRYEEARPWAKAIRDEVLSRRMPPWGAIKGFGDFKHDASLTQEEISRIADWVEGGAPEGDAKYLGEPPAPQEHKTAASTGLRIAGRTVLSRNRVITAIEPLASVESLKVIARKPGGGIEPLLWLYRYDRKWKRTFEYTAPLRLPKGTVVELTTPAPLRLIFSAPRGRR